MQNRTHHESYHAFSFLDVHRLVMFEHVTPKAFFFYFTTKLCNTHILGPFFLFFFVLSAVQLRCNDTVSLG